MNGKTIFYTQRVYDVVEYKERRDAIDQRLPRFLDKCDFLSIGLPNDVDIAKKIVSNVNHDGVLLSGGNTLTEYGGDAPERDKMEHWLLDYAIQHEIPVFGICRGMQLIMSHFGIKLNNVQNHVSKYHAVTGSIARNSVNSYHNMAAFETDNITEHFDIISVAEDGVVEAVKHKVYPIAAIMWHPEREKEHCEDDCALIKKFYNTRGGQLL